MRAKSRSLPASLEDSEIMEGELTCQSCERKFPIVRGIPRFAVLDELESDKAATAENFGWQWQHFVQGDELYADQFLGWLTPVKPEFFRDKLVLEGGCGKGRHTQLAANWGARDVIGVDLSNAVETAFPATRGSRMRILFRPTFTTCRSPECSTTHSQSAYCITYRIPAAALLRSRQK